MQNAPGHDPPGRNTTLRKERPHAVGAWLVLTFAFIGSVLARRVMRAGFYRTDGTDGTNDINITEYTMVANNINDGARGWEACRRRGPVAWAALVGALPAEWRWHVASIVWWDFFAGRPAGERWGHLDAFMAERGLTLDADALARGLVACGYPRARAEARVFPGANQCRRERGVALERMRAGELPRVVAAAMGINARTVACWASAAGLRWKRARGAYDRMRNAECGVRNAGERAAGEGVCAA